MRIVRNIALHMATNLVAMCAGAQTPLTIDPSFEYCVTPELIEQFGEGFEVVDVSLRDDGTIITTGNRLQKVLYPWAASGGGVLLIDNTGAYIESPFTSAASGKITEMTNGQYFYWYRRINSDGNRDWTFGYPSLPWYDVMDWRVFEDRSVLVGGAFKLEEEGQIEYGLIKVDEWGLPDPNFAARKVGPGTSRVVHTLEPLNNGQFLANGTFSTYDGEFSGPVARINADGSRDPSFYFPAWKGTIGVVLEQPDGKLILGGRFWMNDTEDTLKVVRIFPDGSLDPSFNNFVDYRTGTGPWSAMASGVNVLTPLGDGRIVVGGMFDRIDGQMRSCIACIDTLGNLLDCWADGGLVPEAYTPGGGPYAQLFGFECLSNGDCYLFGEYKGFIDAIGLHPRQCLMSRVFMPGVGVDEPVPECSPLTVWPNPGSDRLSFGDQDGSQGTFELRDAGGKLVVQGTLARDVTTINTSHLAGGIYVLNTVLHSGERIYTKWVKQ
ncbi:MAG: T9SS type A sorting domain-containing protein [Flavobacteriales bacterium]